MSFWRIVRNFVSGFESDDDECDVCDGVGNSCRIHADNSDNRISNHASTLSSQDGTSCDNCCSPQNEEHKLEPGCDPLSLGLDVTPGVYPRMLVQGGVLGIQSKLTTSAPQSESMQNVSRVQDPTRLKDAEANTDLSVTSQEVELCQKAVNSVELSVTKESPGPIKEGCDWQLPEVLKSSATEQLMSGDTPNVRIDGSAEIVREQDRAEQLSGIHTANEPIHLQANQIEAHQKKLPNRRSRSVTKKQSRRKHFSGGSAKRSKSADSSEEEKDVSGASTSSYETARERCSLMELRSDEDLLLDPKAPHDLSKPILGQGTGIQKLNAEQLKVWSREITSKATNNQKTGPLKARYDLPVITRKDSITMQLEKISARSRCRSFNYRPDPAK